MGSFRPAHTLTDALGNEWEIYVSRVEQARSRFRRELVALLKPRQEDWDRPAEALRVEAVTYLPHHETYVWVTTSDHIERVLAEIDAELEEGHLARPLGAVFKGSGA